MQEFDTIVKFFEQASLGVIGWAVAWFAVKQYLKKDDEYEEFLDTEIKELKAKLDEEQK